MESVKDRPDQSGSDLLSENYSVDPTLMQDVSNFQKTYLVRDGAKLKIFHGIHNFLRYAAMFPCGVFPSG